MKKKELKPAVDKQGYFILNFEELPALAMYNCVLRDKELNSDDKIIINLIYNGFGRKGCFYFQNNEIADMTGMKMEQVINSLEKLSILKYIEIGLEREKMERTIIPTFKNFTI